MGRCSRASSTPTRSTPRSPTCGTCSRRRRSSTPIPSAHRPPGRSDAELRRGYPEMPPTGPGVPARAAPVPRRVPVLRQRRAQPPVRASRRSSTSWSARWNRPTSALYQTQVSAKYAGDANFEQPMHTDRNHSFLPPRMEPPWWHVESFLYLTDVDEGTAPTHLVRRGDAVGRSTELDLHARQRSRARTRHERAAAGAPRLAARVPARRVPSRRRPHATRQPSLLVERQLQGRGPRTGSATTRCSRTRRIRRGCSSSRGRRRASSSCSGSRRRAIRCGRTSSSTRLSEKYPKLDVEPWRRALRR